MNPPPLDVLLLSDANEANLQAALSADPTEPDIRVRLAPFGTVLQTLLDPGAAAWAEPPDLAVVWTRPDAVLRTVARAMEGEVVSPEGVDDEVDDFVSAVAQGAERARWTLVPTWSVPFGARGLGAIDLHDPSGLRALLFRANTRLTDRLRETKGCWVVDDRPWATMGGPSLLDRRLWYAAKVSHGADVLRAAARDIKAFLRAATGRARKVILLDLDNTLWGGVVGETGWEGLRLGGHDPVGEAFQDFQRALKALSRRGVVLAIVSKNEEEVALEAIRRHPDMVLRPDDFAGWRINWLDKATNVLDLVEGLRLGLDAAVFIDDQPAERARVREALPEVLVPEWPADVLSYVRALDELACFDVLTVSQEDLARTRSYAAERERGALRSRVSSMEEWLEQLGVTVTVERLGPESLPRAAQLLNKTNQMNLATRRMSEAELKEWADGPGRTVYGVRVADRFSDFGLTGIVSVERRGSEAHIVDFVLSCRVMSRRVEETMVHVAVEHARGLAEGEVVARFEPTDRNAPMLAFWRDRSGFTSEDGATFRWRESGPYPLPASIELRDPARASE
jgi:FkbH-like protein